MVYLEKHKEKYPLMQIEDIIKLHLQGILGPAHLLPSKDKIKEMKQNIEQIKLNIRLKYQLLRDIEHITGYVTPNSNK